MKSLDFTKPIIELPKPIAPMRLKIIELPKPIIELPKPSKEQKKIIESFRDNNVLINSVVGAGKTTTVLLLAKAYPERNFLLLTYNKRLKLDTRDRAIELANLEVHSFHSFCVKYYHKNCRTDFGLLQIIKNQPNFDNQNPPAYSAIIVDEAQDLNPLYYEIVCKIIKDFSDYSSVNTRFCIIGDTYQSIYGYNQADPRFITKADKLFAFNKQKWMHEHLTETFRLSRHVTDFVNDALLQEKRIRSNKFFRQKVRYIQCNLHKPGRVYQEIQYYFDKGYTYSDFFILAPSIKNHLNPIRQLANKLSSDKIPIYCPVSDDERLDSEITDGKIVFCTFHQAKGLERKVVLIYNFDSSYFKFYNRNSISTKCPNEIYVATTRTLESLSVFHHTKSNYLPFLHLPELRNTCTIETQELDLKDHTKHKERIVSVTEIIRHLPVSVIEEALSLANIIKIHDKDSIIDIPSKTIQKFGSGSIYESVSEITGIAIPAYFELKRTGEMTINQLMNQESWKKLSVRYDLQSRFYKSDDIQRNTYDGYMFRERDTRIYPLIDPEELLYLANKWNSLSSGYSFKMKQISRYTWLTQNILDRCCQNLEEHISKEACFEIFYKSDFETKEIDSKVLQGYVDCIDHTHKQIWEFKCVTELDRSSFLQVLLYQYLIEHSDSKMSDYSYYLMNILTNEIYQISIDKETLNGLVSFIFKHKYGSPTIVSDTEFIRKCTKIKKKYIDIDSQKKITEFSKNYLKI
jgi:hypothetical protein